LIFKLVKLAPGVNRLQMRVTNEWGSERLSEPISVRVLRPPVTKASDAPAETEKPLVSLSAVVKSLFQLNREGIEVVVNDKPTPVAVEVVGPAGANSEWTVRLTDVPLKEGPNTVKMWARNADARSTRPAEWKIVCKPVKVIPPPEIEIADPAVDLRVTDAKLPVRLRIKSADPLNRVELRRDGGNPIRIDIDPKKFPPDAQGVYNLNTEVELIPGPNALRAIAVNAGGQSDAVRVASFLQEPVELIIESLVPQGMEANPLFPKLNANGQLTVGLLPGGRVKLMGKVYWARDDDEQFKTAKQVRVFVNGFQQQPAELHPFRGVKKKNRPEREFDIDLFLNRPTDNHIEVVLPGLKQRSANRREFVADCANPERIQRLHVLPVVIHDTGAVVDQEKLVKQLAVMIPSVSTATVKLYAPLTDYVSPQKVMTQLIRIKRSLDGTAKKGGSDDLVVVYYQGGEVINADGHFLLTSLSTPSNTNLKSSAVSCEFLTGVFEETLGAEILLFDLTRQPGKGDSLHDVIAQWPDQPNVSIFRYTRQSPTAPRLLSDISKEMGNANTLVDVEKHLAKKLIWKSDEGVWAVPGTDRTSADWRIPVNLGELKVK